MKLWRHLLAVFVLALSLTTAAHAQPGCNGRMWNPISDIDFRLMGQVQKCSPTLA